jgi:putative ABC transport system permease protein
MDPSQLFVVSPTLELVEGLMLPSANNGTTIMVAKKYRDSWAIDLLLSIWDKASYPSVDPDIGEAEEESKCFVVWGIIESAGNPTFNNAVVIGSRPGPRK